MFNCEENSAKMSKNNIVWNFALKRVFQNNDVLTSKIIILCCLCPKEEMTDFHTLRLDILVFF